MVDASNDDVDDDTVEASAFKAGEAGECSGVLAERGKGNRFGRLGMRPGFAIVERLLT